MKILFSKNTFCLWQVLLSMMMARTACGQLFVVTNDITSGGSGNCAILEYDFNGTYMNTIPLPQTDVRGLAISGTNLFAASYANGTISELTTAGVMVNPILVSGLTGPFGMVINGTNLFVAGSQYIGEYTISGTPVNAHLITNSPPALIMGMAVIGTNLFIPNSSSGTIAEYTLDGTIVNTQLVSGLSFPFSVATDGTYLYAVNGAAIGLYNTSGSGGTMINLSYGIGSLIITGTNMFAGNTATIGEYTTSGTTVNASLVTGGNWLWGMAASSISPTSPPPPPVSIATISNQPVIIWPANGGNYVLQTTTNLASNNWVTVSNYVPVTGALITNASSPAFFRLH